MEEKRLTDKRFGVKSYRIEELRRFQFGLKYKRKRKAFIANVLMSINMGPPVHVEIQAQDGRISITPSVFLLEHRLPKQNLINLDDGRIQLQIGEGIQIKLRFASDDDKDHFIRSLDLNLSSSEEDSIRD